MKTYLPGHDVKVTIPFLGTLGEQLTPTALSYQVFDEAGDEVLAPTSIPVFDAASGSVDVTVNAAINTLVAPEVLGYRKIDLIMTTDGGTYRQADEYILKGDTILVLGTNSLQTYEQAVLRSLGMGELKGWEAASKDQRMSALSRAYDAIAAFRYRMVMTDDTVITGDIRELTVEQFNALIPLEKEDFLKAQVAQADFFLNGSPLERDISDGLQSSTIGEVSQFYRPRPSLTTQLSRLALYYVGRYIHWNVAIGRA